MNVASLCQHKLITIDRRATLTQAAQRLREEHVGLLVRIPAAGTAGWKMG
jgi:hypothetical protein